ncbi:MAG: diheme cytochrome c [Desulfobacteraceae bacterium]|nr:diheme cytochrome c [Desulfobacteraceae bacterium]
MKKNTIHIWINFVIIFALMINGSFFIAQADDHGKHNNGKLYQKFMHDDVDDDDHDDDDDKKRKHHRRKNHDSDDHHEKNTLPPVPDPLYINDCGGCHWAYPPDLLPAGSWDKILTGFEDHFGEPVDIDPESEKAIFEYLKTNAADYSPGKLSSKIMRSLGNQTPLRITLVPYILKEHHEIEPDVFKRESIGSLSNCIACHTTAEKGDFDDDNVSIPK